MNFQPKTGARCHCKSGIQRDNCPDCEGTGLRIDFAAIRARVTATAAVARYPNGEGRVLGMRGAAWFVRTGEMRPPRRGEYYLSGAVPEDYLARADLSSPQYILRPIADPPRRVVVDGFSYVLEGAKP